MYVQGQYVYCPNMYCKYSTKIPPTIRWIHARPRNTNCATGQHDENN